MRIDQIHSHEPRLAFCLQFARPCFKPRNSRVGRKIVVPVATKRYVNQITKSKKIREPVGFDHVTVLEQWRVDWLVCCVESAAEMPLPLIGSVIAEFPETSPDGHLVGGHVALPGSLHVFEDARMLDVLTGVDDGACR